MIKKQNIFNSFSYNVCKIRFGLSLFYQVFNDILLKILSLYNGTCIRPQNQLLDSHPIFFLNSGVGG